MQAQNHVGEGVGQRGGRRDTLATGDAVSGDSHAASMKVSETPFATTSTSAVRHGTTLSKGEARNRSPTSSSSNASPISACDTSEGKPMDSCGGEGLSLVPATSTVPELRRSDCGNFPKTQSRRRYSSSFSVSWRSSVSQQGSAEATGASPDSPGSNSLTSPLPLPLSSPPLPPSLPCPSSAPTGDLGQPSQPTESLPATAESTGVAAIHDDAASSAIDRASVSVLPNALHASASEAQLEAVEDAGATSLNSLVHRQIQRPETFAISANVGVADPVPLSVGAVAAVAVMVAAEGGALAATEGTRNSSPLRFDDVDAGPVTSPSATVDPSIPSTSMSPSLCYSSNRLSSVYGVIPRRGSSNGGGGGDGDRLEKLTDSAAEGSGRTASGSGSRSAPYRHDRRSAASALSSAASTPSASLSLSMHSPSRTGASTAASTATSSTASLTTTAVTTEVPSTALAQPAAHLDTLPSGVPPLTMVEHPMRIGEAVVDGRGANAGGVDEVPVHVPHYRKYSTWCGHDDRESSPSRRAECTDARSQESNHQGSLSPADEEDEKVCFPQAASRPSAVLPVDNPLYGAGCDVSPLGHSGVDADVDRAAPEAGGGATSLLATGRNFRGMQEEVIGLLRPHVSTGASGRDEVTKTPTSTTPVEQEKPTEGNDGNHEATQHLPASEPVGKDASSAAAMPRLTMGTTSASMPLHFDGLWRCEEVKEAPTPARVPQGHPMDALGTATTAEQPSHAPIDSQAHSRVERAFPPATRGPASETASNAEAPLPSRGPVDRLASHAYGRADKRKGIDCPLPPCGETSNERKEAERAQDPLSLHLGIRRGEGGGASEPGCGHKGTGPVRIESEHPRSPIVASSSSIPLLPTSSTTQSPPRTTSRFMAPRGPGSSATLNDAMTPSNQDKGPQDVEFRTFTDLATAPRIDRMNKRAVRPRQWAASRSPHGPRPSYLTSQVRVAIIDAQSVHNHLKMRETLLPRSPLRSPHTSSSAFVPVTGLRGSAIRIHRGRNEDDDEAEEVVARREHARINKGDADGDDRVAAAALADRPHARDGGTPHQDVDHKKARTEHSKGPSRAGDAGCTAPMSPQSFSRLQDHDDLNETGRRAGGRDVASDGNASDRAVMHGAPAKRALSRGPGCMPTTAATKYDSEDDGADQPSLKPNFNVGGLYTSFLNRYRHQRLTALTNQNLQSLWHCASAVAKSVCGITLEQAVQMSLVQGPAWMDDLLSYSISAAAVAPRFSPDVSTLARLLPATPPREERHRRYRPSPPSSTVTTATPSPQNTPVRKCVALPTAQETPTPAKVVLPSACTSASAEVPPPELLHCFSHSRIRLEDSCEKVARHPTAEQATGLEKEEEEEECIQDTMEQGRAGPGSEGLPSQPSAPPNLSLIAALQDASGQSPSHSCHIKKSGEDADLQDSPQQLRHRSPAVHPMTRVRSSDMLNLSQPFSGASTTNTTRAGSDEETAQSMSYSSAIRSTSTDTVLVHRSTTNDPASDVAGDDITAAERASPPSSAALDVSKLGSRALPHALHTKPSHLETKASPLTSDLGHNNGGCTSNNSSRASGDGGGVAGTSDVNVCVAVRSALVDVAMPVLRESFIPPGVIPGIPVAMRAGADSGVYTLPATLQHLLRPEERQRRSSPLRSTSSVLVCDATYPNAEHSPQATASAQRVDQREMQLLHSPCALRNGPPLPKSLSIPEAEAGVGSGDPLTSIVVTAAAAADAVAVPLQHGRPPRMAPLPSHAPSCSLVVAKSDVEAAEEIAQVTVAKRASWVTPGSVSTCDALGACTPARADYPGAAEVLHHSIVFSPPASTVPTAPSGGRPCMQAQGEVVATTTAVDAAPAWNANFCAGNAHTSATASAVSPRTKGDTLHVHWGQVAGFYSAAYAVATDRTAACTTQPQVDPALHGRCPQKGGTAHADGTAIPTAEQILLRGAARRSKVQSDEAAAPTGQTTSAPTAVPEATMGGAGSPKVDPMEGISHPSCACGKRAALWMPEPAFFHRSRRKVDLHVPPTHSAVAAAAAITTALASFISTGESRESRRGHRDPLSAAPRHAEIPTAAATAATGEKAYLSSLSALPPLRTGGRSSLDSHWCKAARRGGMESRVPSQDDTRCLNPPPLPTVGLSVMQTNRCVASAGQRTDSPGPPPRSVSQVAAAENTEDTDASAGPHADDSKQCFLAYLRKVLEFSLPSAPLRSLQPASPPSDVTQATLSPPQAMLIDTSADRKHPSDSREHGRSHETPGQGSVRVPVDNPSKQYAPCVNAVTHATHDAAMVHDDNVTAVHSRDSGHDGGGSEAEKGSLSLSHSPAKREATDPPRPHYQLPLTNKTPQPFLTLTVGAPSTRVSSLEEEQPTEAAVGVLCLRNTRAPAIACAAAEVQPVDVPNSFLTPPGPPRHADPWSVASHAESSPPIFSQAEHYPRSCAGGSEGEAGDGTKRCGSSHNDCTKLSTSIQPPAMLPEERSAKSHGECGPFSFSSASALAPPSTTAPLRLVSSEMVAEPPAPSMEGAPALNHRDQEDHDRERANHMDSTPEPWPRDGRGDDVSSVSAAQTASALPPDDHTLSEEKDIARLSSPTLDPSVSRPVRVDSATYKPLADAAAAAVVVVVRADVHPSAESVSSLQAMVQPMDSPHAVPVMESSEYQNGGDVSAEARAKSAVEVRNGVGRNVGDGDGDGGEHGGRKEEASTDDASARGVEEASPPMLISLNFVSFPSPPTPPDQPQDGDRQLTLASLSALTSSSSEPHSGGRVVATRLPSSITASPQGLLCGSSTVTSSRVEGGAPVARLHCCRSTCEFVAASTAMAVALRAATNAAHLGGAPTPAGETAFSEPSLLNAVTTHMASDSARSERRGGAVGAEDRIGAPDMPSVSFPSGATGEAVSAALDTRLVDDAHMEDNLHDASTASAAAAVMERVDISSEHDAKTPQLDSIVCSASTSAVPSRRKTLLLPLSSPTPSLTVLPLVSSSSPLHNASAVVEAEGRSTEVKGDSVAPTAAGAPADTLHDSFPLLEREPEGVTDDNERRGTSTNTHQGPGNDGASCEQAPLMSLQVSVEAATTASAEELVLLDSHGPHNLQGESHRLAGLGKDTSYKHAPSPGDAADSPTLLPLPGMGALEGTAAASSVDLESEVPVFTTTAGIAVGNYDILRKECHPPLPAASSSSSPSLPMGGGASPLHPSQALPPIAVPASTQTLTMKALAVRHEVAPLTRTPSLHHRLSRDREAYSRASVSASSGNGDSEVGHASREVAAQEEVVGAVPSATLVGSGTSRDSGSGESGSTSNAMTALSSMTATSSAVAVPDGEEEEDVLPTPQGREKKLEEIESLTKAIIKGGVAEVTTTVTKSEAGCSPLASLVEALVAPPREVHEEVTRSLTPPLMPAADADDGATLLRLRPQPSAMQEHRPLFPSSSPTATLQGDDGAVWASAAVDSRQAVLPATAPPHFPLHPESTPLTTGPESTERTVAEVRQSTTEQPSTIPYATRGGETPLPNSRPLSRGPAFRARSGASAEAQQPSSLPSPHSLPTYYLAQCEDGLADVADAQHGWHVTRSAFFPPATSAITHAASTGQGIAGNPPSAEARVSHSYDVYVSASAFARRRALRSAFYKSFCPLPTTAVPAPQSRTP